MNHGPFYRSAELVAGVHQAQGAIFEGFRAAHAFGRIYSGTFAATPEAKALSRAAHFQGTPVPVTARLSGTSGNPEKKASKVVAMATKFYLPNGTVTDLIAISALPAFFARTPEEFLATTDALTPDPATGQRDPAKIQRAEKTSDVTGPRRRIRHRRAACMRTPCSHHRRKAMSTSSATR